MDELKAYHKVFKIKYHFVFCIKYRKDLFLDKNIPIQSKKLALDWKRDIQ